MGSVAYIKDYIKDEKKIRAALEREKRDLLKLREAVIGGLEDVSNTLTTHADVLENKNYSPTEVSVLTSKFKHLSDFFKKIAKVASEITEDKGMVALKGYCEQIAKELDILQDAISNNALPSGFKTRKLEGVQDVIDELNKIFRNARESLDRSMKERFEFMDYEFKHHG